MGARAHIELRNHRFLSVRQIFPKYLLFFGDEISGRCSRVRILASIQVAALIQVYFNKDVTSYYIYVYIYIHPIYFIHYLLVEGCSLVTESR